MTPSIRLGTPHRALKRLPFCAIFSHPNKNVLPRRRSVGAEEYVLTSKPYRRLAPLFSALSLSLWSAIAPADNACGIAAPQLPTSTDGNAPIQVEADAATFQPDSGNTLFEGHAELSQPGRRLEAARMTYQRDTDRLDAEGQVRLTQPDLIISGSSAHYQPQRGEGAVNDAQYALPGQAGRGEAAQVSLAADGRIQLTQPTYTTCPDGKRAWAIEAEHMTLDRSTGRGTARGAHLELGGVDLPGLPEFSFPIDGRRHSGLLPPTLGYGSRNGMDLTVPYYFNLAPNQDLTLSPRLMSKRGSMLGGEYRYLTPNFGGELRAEILPEDRVYRGSSPRGGASWRHNGRPFSGWRSRVDASYVSDDDYLSDLGNDLSTSATTSLERVAELSRLTQRSNIIFRVQNFQTLDPAIAPADQPYSRLPQLLAGFNQPLGQHSRLLLDTEYVHFDRGTGVTGQRVDLQPTLAMRWERSWGYVEPRAGVRYTGYRLDNNPFGDDNPDRFTSSLSLDSGLIFDRQTRWGGRDMTQTLEPRLFYLYVPREDQSELPVFDTARYDFRFDSLFQDDRFNGPDRVGDTHQLSVALTSRLRDNRSGAERLQLGIGQIFYFDDRQVLLPGETQLDKNRSALVAGASAIINPHWRVEAATQWDPDYGNDGEITRGLLRVAWDDGEGHRLNAGYRLRRGETEQTDLAGSWRLNARTRLIGRWTYSLLRSRNLETLAGLEYGSCCWKVRAVVQRHLDTTSDKANLGVLLQLELTGLGRLGKNIDDLMNGGLAGYRPTSQ